MREKISVLLCGLFLLAPAALINVANASDSTQKEWTFLVYLNGNNNLDSFGTLNINQMEMVGSTDQVNVVVQWASYGTHKVQRLLVKKDNDTTNVTSPVVQDLGAVDMGDWHSLADFIKWGAANYPAKHYLVDVWDHGSGWHQLQAMESGTKMIGAQGAIFHPTDISWDDYTGHFISTKELGQALADGAASIGHKIDVYGSDACLMAMAEVAGEMKDSVSYFVGSQDLEPGAGWPYDQILSKWTAGATGKDVAVLVAQEYTKSYQGGTNGSQEVTASAYDLGQMDALQQSVQALGAELMKLDAAGHAKISQAASNAAKFTYYDYGDLIDFVNLVEAAKVDNMNRGVISQVRNATDQFILTNNVTTSWNGKAHGVSFWLPASTYDYSNYSAKYATLNFANATHWSDALQSFLKDGTSSGGDWWNPGGRQN